MRGQAIRIVGILAFVVFLANAPADSGQPGASLDVETLTNRVDGSEILGCRSRQQTSGRKRAAWIAFGTVRQAGAKGWKAAGSRIDCGDGLFDKTRSRPGRIIGIPYLVADIEASAGDLPTGKIRVESTVTLRKLTGFGPRGAPLYESASTKRVLDLIAGDEMVVPLLLADEAERDAFGVHEVFLRVKPRVAGKTAYGVVSVSADAPAMSIFLDGGLVGRTSEDAPTLVRNVLVGKHEMKVRDFSGREARKTIEVKKDATAAVALDVLGLPPRDTRAALTLLGKNEQGHEEYWRSRDGAIVVRIPPGDFLMGSGDGEGEPSERPRRLVHLSGFFIDKTEVTWRQFRKYVEATGAPLPPAPLWGTPDDYAVAGAQWDEARAYCEWVGGRLPTEAEWEKAARGTDGRAWPWGNDWDPDRCNSWDGGPHRPEPVGSFPGCVSPYGVLDMPGSVWEWCADWFAEGYDSETLRDPGGPAEGTMRVLRGGAWLNQPGWLRAAYRYRNAPSARYIHNGFRCARSALE